MGDTISLQLKESVPLDKNTRTSASTKERAAKSSHHTCLSECVIVHCKKGDQRTEHRGIAKDRMQCIQTMLLHTEERSGVHRLLGCMLVDEDVDLEDEGHSAPGNIDSGGQDCRKCIHNNRTIDWKWTLLEQSKRLLDDQDGERTTVESKTIPEITYRSAHKHKSHSR